MRVRVGGSLSHSPLDAASDRWVLHSGGRTARKKRVERLPEILAGHRDVRLRAARIKLAAVKKSVAAIKQVEIWRALGIKGARDRLGLVEEIWKAVSRVARLADHRLRTVLWILRGVV